MSKDVKLAELQARANAYYECADCLDSNDSALYELFMEKRQWALDEIRLLETDS